MLTPEQEESEDIRNEIFESIADDYGTETEAREEVDRILQERLDRKRCGCKVCVC